jgi:hypothetical protein
VTEKAGEEAGIDRRLASLPSDLQARVKKIWNADEWEALSREERRRLASWILKLIDSDAREALEAETLGIRGEEHVSRTVSLVDEQGWRELNRIQDEALWAILVAKTESAERLAETREDGMLVLSAMLCFELAERPPDAD